MRHLIESLEGRRLLATVPSGFVDQAFGTSFSGATAMDFAPDGRLFALTQDGKLYVTTAAGTTNLAGTLPVNSYFERGLLGVAFDPAFSSNNYIYLYYTEIPSGGTASSTAATFNRISRFTMTGNTLNTASETLVMRLDQVSAGNHNGGAIHFGPDGKLYVAVGENAVPSRAQSLTTRHGKILRINADGTIPSDNPTSFPGISGSPSGVYQSIWAVGLRNPFTFTFQPGTGTMFINDVGQNTWEEIDRGIAGRNYGWSATEGDFNQASFPNFTRPVYSYGHGSAFPLGNCIAGGAFYTSSASTQFPAAYQGKYFFGDATADWIGVIDPAAPPGVSGATPVFATGASGVVDLKIGPDGALYYLQRNGTPGIRRVIVNPSTAPSILNQPGNQNLFDGQTASFSVTAGGNAPLGYQWQRNNVNINGATSATYTLNNVQLADNGATFRCVVTNSIGTAISNPATLNVTVNQAPVPTILTPSTGTFVSGGETINFTGSATDPETGALGASALTWRVDYYTGGLQRPFAPEFSNATGGSFVAHTRTPYTSPDVFYRIVLRATDPAGRTTEVFRDVSPRTSTVTLATSGVPSGINLTLDGAAFTPSNNFTGVVGVIREIGAPATQTISGQTYQFQNWSDGGSATHEISTPLANQTFTATYKDITLPVVNPGSFDFNNTTAGQSVKFSFSENVGASITSSDLIVLRRDDNTTLPASAITTNYNTATNELTVTFPATPGGKRFADGNYRVTLLAAGVTDAAGNAIASDRSVDLFALDADANRDRSVDTVDFNLLLASFGGSNKTFSQGNFNYDTAIDSGDFNILVTRFGQTLPAIPPASAPRPTIGGSGPTDDPEDDLI